MQFKALCPEHFQYFKDVLGISSLFLEPERMATDTKFYPKAVVVDEEINNEKKQLLNKILKAFAFSEAQLLKATDCNQDLEIAEALVFGRHLENKIEAESFLVAPALQDLMDEPALKKVLWKDMQDYMKGKKS